MPPPKDAKGGKKVEEPPKKEEPPKQFKIFIYELDSYLGKVLGEKSKKHAAEGEQPIICGCLQDPRSRPSWADEIIRSDDLLALKKALLSSDVIVYDLSSSGREATAALKVLLKYDYAENPEDETEKVMIGVSSLLSWAGNSIPLPQESLDGTPPVEVPIPFISETGNLDDRRPHPNYKAQVTVENLVIHKGNIKKDKLKTYVIWSGVLYGCGEGVFHSLFKCSWTGTHKALPVLANGKNKIPMVHVSDLSGIVLAVAHKRPTEFNTFMAVDQADTTLYQVVAAISSVLQEGEVHSCSRDEYLAFMSEQDEPHVHSIYLQLNLKMQSARGESIGYGPAGESWQYKSGMVDNMAKVVDEYRAWRSLQPMRVLFLGPPASGWVKTVDGRVYLARDFAEEYQVTYIDPKGLVEEFKGREDLELSAKLREATEGGGEAPEELVREAVQRKLQTPECRNQGWVLDGFPDRREEAEALFDVDKLSVDADAPPPDDPPPQDPPSRPAPVPETVFSLGASKEFLLNRIAGLTEEEAAAAGETEEEFEGAYAAFCEANPTDEAGLVGGVVGLMRDNRAKGCLRVVHVELENELSYLQDLLRLSVGQPRNYQPARARLEREAAAAARAEQREREAAAARAVEEEAGRSEREARAREDAEKLGRLQAEEREALLVRSQPMRKYLMDHVLPTLTRGLQEVAKVRPEDPVDYLAEFLFKADPQLS